MTGGLLAAWRVPNHAHRVSQRFRIRLHLGNTGRVGEVAEGLRQLLVTGAQRAIRRLCRKNLKLCRPLQIKARCKHSRPRRMNPSPRKCNLILAKSRQTGIKTDTAEKKLDAASETAREVVHLRSGYAWFCRLPPDAAAGGCGNTM
jgi:hypothetical protein